MDICLFVARNQVERVWPLALPYLNRTSDYHWTVDDMLAAAMRGDVQLWIGLTDNRVSGVCLSKIINHHACSVLRLTTMGGDGGDWNKMLDEPEIFARHHNCSRIEITGRRGWLKALEGFEEIHTTIAKELN